MNQATLDLAPAAACRAAPTPAVAEADRTGFDIGWDYAHHGLVPPAELLLDGTPLGQGWRAGRAVFGRRTLATQRTTRQWLALRTLAWRRGINFAAMAVTPQFLAQIHAARCPVTRASLGGAEGKPEALVVERLDRQAGYAAGNLAVVSQLAARAGAGVDVTEALRRAHHGEVVAGPVDGLDAAAWLRLAVLRSFVSRLPFHEAARLPLVLLPPPHVHPVNPVQRLQLLLTTQFAAPGWSNRTRALAEWLPAHTLRHDYNLFIGALAPRVIEAAAAGLDTPRALEGAWLDERVRRRWQHLVSSLGEAATVTLLDRAAAALALLAAPRLRDRPTQGSGAGLGRPAVVLQHKTPAPKRRLAESARDALARPDWVLQTPGTGSGTPPSGAVGSRLSQRQCASDR